MQFKGGVLVEKLCLRYLAKLGVQMSGLVAVTIHFCPLCKPIIFIIVQGPSTLHSTSLILELFEKNSVRKIL